MRDAFIWLKTKRLFPWFLIIYVGIIDAVFLFQKILFADKITKFSSNTQKYLHISEKSSTFALDFSNVRWRVAIVAQLVEQRIRNAWVAGSSPASGSKRRKRVSTLFFFFLCSLSIGLRTVKGPPKRSWCFGEERRLVAANSFVFCVYIHIFYDSMVLFLWLDQIS